MAARQRSIPAADWRRGIASAQAASKGREKRPYLLRVLHHQFSNYGRLSYCLGWESHSIAHHQNSGQCRCSTPTTTHWRTPRSKASKLSLANRD
jgi:hypothetical protein